MMERPTHLGGVLAHTRRNAALAWVLVVGMGATAVRSAIEGAILWMVFVSAVVCIVLVPALVFRDPLVMPPWELLVLAGAPLLWETLAGRPLATYLSVAAVALLIAVEIHHFTRVRMNHTFAIGLVVISTLAVAGGWTVLRWVSDIVLATTFLLDGRPQDTINDAVMIEFGYAVLAGIGAGVLFDLYFRTRTEVSAPPPERPRSPPPVSRRLPRRLRAPINVSDRHKRLVSRAMQVILAVLLGFGVLARDISVVANAGVALGLTFVPAILARDYRIPIGPGLGLWITAAVFLHALGSAGLYEGIVRWDALTHALSASVVAAAGYTVVRAIDLHTDEVYLPPRMLVICILLFSLAMGVVWELLEFGIDLGAAVLDIEAVLAQHGIDDTVRDLLFDAVGAIAVTLWGTAALTDVSTALSDRFDELRAEYD